MKEEILTFGKDNSLVGILAHAENKLEGEKKCVVLVNAGLIHKVGPNRLYVNIARKLALENVPCFRFDFSNIGDSENSSRNLRKEEEKNLQIKQAIDLAQKFTGALSIILIGMCSGADDVYNFALSDNRVTGLFLIDGIFHDRQMIKDIYAIASRNCAIRYYKKNLLNFQKWIELLSGKSGALNQKNLGVAFKLVQSKFKKLFRFRFKSSITQCGLEEKLEFPIDIWRKLVENNVQTKVVFCEGGNAFDIFKLTVENRIKKLDKQGILSFELIKDVDHTFTPLWSQKLLIGKICSWISIQ